jgi:carbamoyl-phosphate synthase large subunit
MAKLATRLMMGESLASLELKEKKIPHFGAKEAVFPFDKFDNVDPVLGPEMRSTGEVLGMSENFGLAFYKSQEAASASLPELPEEGKVKKVLISLSEKVHQAKDAVEVGRGFHRMGFSILATEGTAAFFQKEGIPCEVIAKLNEGRPNVLDVILNKEVCLAINTPSAKKDVIKDEAAIRQAVIKYKVPYITTLAAAKAAVQGILASSKGKGSVKSIQEFHKEIC